MTQFNYPLATSGLTESGNFAGKLASAARDFACDLYRQQPRWILDGQVYHPVVALWDTVCGTPPLPTPPLPPPPTVPFTGGQCVGVNYGVTIREYSLRTNPIRYEQTGQGEVTSRFNPITAKNEMLKGPVEGLVLIPGSINTGTGQNPARNQNFAVQLRCNGINYSYTNTVRYLENNGSIPFGSFAVYYEIISVRRIDGQADNCGSLPPQHPDVPPPPNFNTRNVTIPTNNNFNFTVPLVFNKPTLSLNPSFTVNFNIAPEFYGEVNFNLGGININFDLPGNGGGSDPDITNIINRLENLQLDFNEFNNELELNLDNSTEFRNEFNEYRNEFNEYRNEFNETNNQIENINQFNLQLQVDINNLNEEINNIDDKLDEGVNCKIDTEIIEVNNSDFDEDYDWEFSTTSVEVPKADKPIIQLLFNELSEVKEYAGRPRSTCSGVPIESYDLPTISCCVLYFAKYLGQQENIGRYITIPNPNIDAIKQWANIDREYSTGRHFKYVRFVSSRGNKIQVYGSSPELASQQIVELLGLTNYTAEDIYFDAPVREVTEKRIEQLKLKYVTYYPDNTTSKRGKQGGTIIWRSPNIRSS